MVEVTAHFTVKYHLTQVSNFEKLDPLVCKERWTLKIKPLILTTDTLYASLQWESVFLLPTVEYVLATLLEGKITGDKRLRLFNFDAIHARRELMSGDDGNLIS